jgi:hypothetical protein
MQSTLSMLMDTSNQAARVTWEVDCRTADVAHRNEDKAKQKLRSNRRVGEYLHIYVCLAWVSIVPTEYYLLNSNSMINIVLARAQQLRAITILSGSITGFTFTVFTSLEIKGNIELYLSRLSYLCNLLCR